MQKNKITLLFLGLLIPACGGVPPAFSPLGDKVMRVEEVVPGYGETIGKDGVVSIKFSRPIDLKTVSPKNILITEAAFLPDELDEIETSQIDAVVGTFEYKVEDNIVAFVPSGGFTKDAEYSLVINSRLRSTDNIPLCSDGSCEKYFLSKFVVVIGAREEGTNSYPEDEGEVDSGDTGGGSNGGDGPDQAAGGSVDRPGYIYINEVYYDPAGVDTEGDEFIELFGEPNTDIGGYSIALVNGDDGKTYDTISIPENSIIGGDGLFVIADTGTGGSSKITDADLLENFDPQNGPDSVQLFDEKQGILDVVGYGDLKIGAAQNGQPMYEGKPSVDAASGSSISRVDGADDTGDNSVDFVASGAPSPGAFDAAQ